LDLETGSTFCSAYLRLEPKGRYAARVRSWLSQRQSRSAGGSD
jgi:hypothetical protein